MLYIETRITEPNKNMFFYENAKIAIFYVRFFIFFEILT